MSEGTSAVEPRSEQPAQLTPVGAMRRYDIAAALLWLITAALTVVSRGVAPEPVTSAGYLLALLGVAGLLLVGRRVASAPTPAVA